MTTPATATQRWAGIRIRILGTQLAVAALVATATITTVTSGLDPAGGTASNVPSSATAEAWMGRALAAVRTGSPALHTGTPGAARTYAMTTTAMYDAVNGIDVAAGTSTRGRAVVGSYAGAPSDGSTEAAASAAAHRVLRSVFASNTSVASSVDAAHEADLDQLGRGDSAVEAGRSWGAAVGQAVLDARAADGTQTAETKPAGTGPGAFPRAFSGAQFRTMTPFGVRSAAAYASSGPPSLSSAEYAEDVNEVKALGSSTDTDPTRRDIARHWLAEGGTVRETGLWFKAALSIIRGRPEAASLSDAVRLFALLGMGIADAVSVSWADKHSFHLWRPGDAIRQASTDGNPATEEDPTWSPRNGVCTAAAVASCTVFGGTPEHTSGTATFAGAASAVLAGFFCTDSVPFAFTGEQPGSAPRSYRGFAEAAREAGRSRIYGGIHFQFSNDVGREAGKGIGQEIVRTRLVPGGGGGGATGCAGAPTT